MLTETRVADKYIVYLSFDGNIKKVAWKGTAAVFLQTFAFYCTLPVVCSVLPVCRRNTWKNESGIK